LVEGCSRCPSHGLTIGRVLGLRRVHARRLAGEDEESSQGDQTDLRSSASDTNRFQVSAEHQLTGS
jgi:hypothetical protein